MRFLRTPLTGLVPVLVVAAALQIGCAGPQPKSVKLDGIGQDQGVIYIYRAAPASALDAIFQPALEIDGQVVCRLGPGEYYAHVYEPGRITLYAKVEQKNGDSTGSVSSGITIDVKAGRDYYVRMVIPLGDLAEQSVLTQVAKRRGRTDIRDCQEILP